MFNNVGHKVGMVLKLLFRLSRVRINDVDNGIKGTCPQMTVSDQRQTT